MHVNEHQRTIGVLRDDFEQLPERLISINADSSVYAQYAMPTQRYRHGILGDAIEAGQLVVVYDGTVLVHTLDTDHVFEDLAPRLVDIDGDGLVEVVTIRTHVARGAGLAIYRMTQGDLVEHAWVAEIGTPSRWLNIAAIHDLDGDDTMDLAWVQTPHIGGILRVASIAAGELTVRAEVAQFSNHAIGARNLCLSVVTRGDGGPTLWLPAQNRSRIVGLALRNDGFVEVGAVEQPVDFARPLVSQHDFGGVVQTGVCP